MKLAFKKKDKPKMILKKKQTPVKTKGSRYA